MLEFSFALAAFFVSHRLPTRPSVRRWLVAKLGEPLYRLIYGVISIAVLAWLIAAAVRAPAVILWWPQPWQTYVPLWLMPVSLALIGAAALSPNPLSVNLRAVSFDPSRPGIVSITRHPMLWGFGLWALSHAVANGDLVSLILFGGLGAFALIGMRILDVKLQNRLGEQEWRRLAESTSVLPLGAVFAARATLHVDARMMLGVLIGIGFYAWFVVRGHELVIGADPLGLIAP